MVKLQCSKVFMLVLFIASSAAAKTSQVATNKVPEGTWSKTAEGKWCENRIIVGTGTFAECQDKVLADSKCSKVTYSNPKNDNCFCVPAGDTCVEKPAGFTDIYEFMAGKAQSDEEKKLDAKIDAVLKTAKEALSGEDSCAGDAKNHLEKVRAQHQFAITKGEFKAKVWEINKMINDTADVCNEVNAWKFMTVDWDKHALGGKSFEESLFSKMNKKGLGHWPTIVEAMTFPEALHTRPNKIKVRRLDFYKFCSGAVSDGGCGESEKSCGIGCDNDDKSCKKETCGQDLVADMSSCKGSPKEGCPVMRTKEGRPMHTGWMKEGCPDEALEYTHGRTTLCLNRTNTFRMTPYGVAEIQDFDGKGNAKLWAPKVKEGQEHSMDFDFGFWESQVTESNMLFSDWLPLHDFQFQPKWMAQSLRDLENLCEDYQYESYHLIKDIKKSVEKIEKLHASKDCKEMNCGDELMEANLHMKETVLRLTNPHGPFQGMKEIVHQFNHLCGNCLPLPDCPPELGHVPECRKGRWWRHL